MDANRSLRAEGSIFAAKVPYKLTPGGKMRTALVQVDSSGKYVKFLGSVKSEKTINYAPYLHIKPLIRGHSETYWQVEPQNGKPARSYAVHTVTFEKEIFTPPNMDLIFNLHALTRGKVEIMQLSFGKGN